MANHDPWDVVLISEWVEGLTLRRSFLVVVEYHVRILVRGTAEADSWLLGQAVGHLVAQMTMEALEES